MVVPVERYDNTFNHFRMNRAVCSWSTIAPTAIEQLDVGLDGWESLATEYDERLQ